MKKRNVAAVFFLPIITFGIYGIVWHVKTKNEMNKLGADIPTAWLLIIPFVNLYWLWKYSKGVDKVSNGKLSAPVAFLLLLLLSVIGMVLVQNEFNSLNAAPVDANAPVPAAPVAETATPAVTPSDAAPVVSPTTGDGPTSAPPTVTPPAAPPTA